MGLTFVADGTILADGTEQELFSQVTSSSLHGCTVSTHEMAASDTLVVRIYAWDANAAAERLFQTSTFNNAQTDVLKLFDFIPTQRFRVTIEQTAIGSYRNYTWERSEVV